MGAPLQDKMSLAGSRAVHEGMGRVQVETLQFAACWGW